MSFSRRDIEFYLSCYFTLGLSTVAVGLTLLVYLFPNFYAYANLEPFYKSYLLTLAILLVFLMAFSFVYSLAEEKKHVLDNFPLPIPKIHRRVQLLPLFTSLFLLSIVAVVYLTGGAQRSPFSHYLVSVSALAVVYAQRPRNRFLVVLLAFAGYLLTLYYFVPQNPELLVAPKLFNASMTLVAIGFGVMAAWRVEEDDGADAAEDLETNPNQSVREAHPLDRLVKGVSRDHETGVISALLNPGEAWSPRPLSNVIVDIEANLVRYFVETRSGKVYISVVKNPFDVHLRAESAHTGEDVLKELPEID